MQAAGTKGKVLSMPERGRKNMISEEEEKKNMEGKTDRKCRSQTDSEKALLHVTCESAAMLPERGSIFRGGMYTGLVERDHDNKQYATRCLQR